MKTATGRQIYSCPYCDRTGMTEGESKRHRRTHPPETRVLTCPVCGHVFRPGFGGAYLRHVAAHAKQEVWLHRFVRADEATVRSTEDKET